MAPTTNATTPTTRGRSGTLVGISVGTRCFVPDKRRIWVPVTVEYVDPQRHVVTFTLDQEDDEDPHRKSSKRETIEFSLNDHPHFPLQNARAVTRGGYEDMIELNHLHEAAILYNLKRRFQSRLPYTFTGEICLAVNPYQWLEELYTQDLHAKYLSAPSRKQLPPHVYAVSVAAYKHMLAQEMNQSILVSGESGAGKTETTKILMDNLARIAKSSNSNKQQQSTIQRILDVNPLLESFGNAKTKRNDNSSRFGKFTQLQFQQQTRTTVLCGAKCETYLLEKTRVVTQEKGERNYHIFYQVFHGSSSQEKELWGLDGSADCAEFNYIQDDDPHMRDKDARNYDKTKHALSLLGLSDVEQGALFQTLAGVLHLGQAEFQADKHNEDASHVVHSSVMIAGELLGLTFAPMEKALCTRTMKAGGDVYAVPLNAIQASSSRDALAKAIYSNVFTWMVGQINDSLSAVTADVSQSIGVLDIFGFESFVHNSFEQLCINYANEKLQQKFTQDVFKAVQEEYQTEEITWDHIEYADNADVLALIEGKLGIIALLNEEIVRPKGNDEGFVGKLATSFRTQKKIIEFPRISRTQFCINHYADTVKYEASGFLEKHKDALLPDLSDLMRGSTAPFVKQLFEVKEIESAVPAPQPGRGRRVGGANAGSSDSQTVGTQFKQSLNRLMDNINKTNVHYIRCIKPNSEKSTTLIDEQMVVNQLRCAGVIEAICIARAGYPNRMKHEEFVREFDLFLSDAQRKRVGEERKLCVVLAKMFALSSPEEYQMGKSKIYLQKGVQERLEGAKAEKLFDCVALIQSRWRGLVVRRWYVRLYAALRVIQRRAHVFVAVLRFHRSQQAVRLMQRVWRGHVGRCEFRGRLEDHRSRLIQRVWRGHVGRCVYRKLLCEHRAVQIQCAWRCYSSRKLLWVIRVAYEREQARLRAEELERQRRLEYLRQQAEKEAERKRQIAEAVEAEAQRRRKQRDEMERQRRLAEEARAEALRLKLEQEEEERRRREEEGRLELERLERERVENERLERERQEQLEREREEQERVERERQERMQREREERERREREEHEERLRVEKEMREQEEKAAVILQRVTRGAAARQECRRLRQERDDRERLLREEHEAKLRAEEQAAVNLQRVARGGLARQKYAQLRLEDEVLKRKALPQLQIVKSAVVEDDPEALDAAKQENLKLKRQLEDLLEANIELETLVSEWKCEQEVLRATSHVQETDLKRQITQQRQKLETANGEYATLCTYIDQNGGELPKRTNTEHDGQPQDDDSDSDSSCDDNSTHFASPFADDRPSTDASILDQKKSTMSTRLKSRKDVLRAGAKQIDIAKSWVNKKNGKKTSSVSSMSTHNSHRTSHIPNAGQGSSTASTKNSSVRVPRFRWKKD